MRVLNLLTSGEAGGIESLCRDIGLHSEFENGFCFLFGEGAIYGQMKDAGLKVHSLSGVGKKFGFKKNKALKKIAKDYDIIVVHHGDIFLKLHHWLLSKELKKKFVTVIHSCYEERYFFPGSKIKKIIGHWVFQAGLKISDSIIFVSNAGRESYEPIFKMDCKKIRIVYNGIGLDKIEAGKAAKVNRDKPYNLTYIGRLSHVKGVDLLIRAAARIRDEYPVKVSIIGDGGDRSRLESITSELGMNDIVTFYGRKTDVKPYLKNASIFVYPSTWQEVFGISLVEGMAYGRPCVANRVGGIPEIIEDGVSGYLTRDLSEEALADTLKKVIQDIEMGKIDIISKNAKDRANKFSIKSTVKQLKSEYEKILSLKQIIN